MTESKKNDECGQGTLNGVQDASRVDKDETNRDGEEKERLPHESG